MTGVSGRLGLVGLGTGFIVGGFSGLLDAIIGVCGLATGLGLDVDVLGFAGVWARAGFGAIDSVTSMPFWTLLDWIAETLSS